MLRKRTFRGLVEGTPHIDVGEVFRVIRGGRGGPRAARAMRKLSDGTWSTSALSLTVSNGFDEGQRYALSVAVSGRSGSLTLSANDGLVRMSASLVGKPMRFGGVRWWACCPRCGTRCGALFFGEASLACRKCAGVTYTSTRLRRSARAYLAMKRHRNRLPTHERGADFWSAPERPLRMRHVTYARWFWRWYELAMRDLAALPGG